MYKLLALTAGSALLGQTHAAAIATIVTTITTSQQPDYFQTSPEIYQGPTSTNAEPFLRETNPAPFAGVTYTPPAPLETQVPIRQAKADDNIFTLLGNIGPYHASPGFGVDEYPIPKGAEIVWLNTLHRHGSRYPTDTIPLAMEITSSNVSFTGALNWLNDWTNLLGVQILTPVGRQELYDSGVLHNYNYGHLFNPNSTKKLLARSTTQDRMVKSAQNFMAGFFGLSYSDYVDIELIIDITGYNNSLAGYNVCPNSDNYENSAGANVSAAWIEKYTAPAVKRFNGMTKGFTWDSTAVYSAQQYCAYETVALGYSKWCSLFSYKEWEYFEYAIDLDFAGTFGFQSPTARADGIGYVAEVLARINHHLITKSVGSINVTLDSMESTFPTNQVLNFDFTHEVNLFSVLTAFGMKQFAPLLDQHNYQANRELIVSHMVPFGCRLDIELIDSPQPISASRKSSSAESDFVAGGSTTYIHFILNQRTLPLGMSIPSCGKRDDGWCELSTFLAAQKSAVKEANYNYACNGNYTPPAWGTIMNGAPPMGMSM